MTNQKELISIVIPAHNEEYLIRDCLQSLKKQKHDGPMEIIVVDNNSTDNTAKIAREEGAIVVFEHTPGVCSARQAGTTYAHGSIIISTDADSSFPADWVQRIYDAFEKHKNVVVVGGSFDMVDAPWWGEIYTGLIFGLLKLNYRLTGRIACVFGSNTAFRKSAWEGYDTTMLQGGDEVVLLKQLKKHGDALMLFDNKISTSSRRLKKGFFHFLIFYVGDYFFCLLTGKSLVAPRAIRLQKEKTLNK